METAFSLHILRHDLSLTCLLTVMACGYFVAICHPMHYSVLTKPEVCGVLVLAS
jgi:hypothetical protein